MDKLLGKQAQDKVTGFEGLITGRAEYLYGCAQYCLMPQAREGKVLDAIWIDEGRVEIIGKGIAPADVAGAVPGGPQRDAPPVR